MEVGETWQYLMPKCVLKVVGQEKKEVCGTNQLFRGMEAGIEGGGPCYAHPVAEVSPGGGFGLLKTPIMQYHCHW